MPPEKSAEVQEWLLKAAHDLSAAGRLMTGDDPLLDVAVYHCQQAAEKILKGFLTWHDKPFPKTHSLVQLLAQSARIDADFDSLQDHAEILSPFAWRFRYPGDLLNPAMEEAREAIEMARQVTDFVCARLPAEVLPDRDAS